MITRESLLRNPGYWLAENQSEIYAQVFEYMEKEGLNQREFASKLNVSKGYVSQILKGEFNYTLKKIVELGLAIGKIPKIIFKPIEDVIREDKRDMDFITQSYGQTYNSQNAELHKRNKTYLFEAYRINHLKSPNKELTNA